MVTFKSRYSLPPYRIENACSDVVCWFAQVRDRSLADLLHIVKGDRHFHTPNTEAHTGR